MPPATVGVTDAPATAVADAICEETPLVSESLELVPCAVCKVDLLGTPALVREVGGLLVGDWSELLFVGSNGATFLVVNLLVEVESELSAFESAEYLEVIPLTEGLYVSRMECTEVFLSD